MSVPRSELVNFCALLAQHRNLRVTIRESLKGALITGLGALIGGLVGGPRGLAIGGAATAVCVGVTSSGNYKSVIEVIRDDLTEDQREELADAVWAVVRTIDSSSAFSAATLLATVLQDSLLEGAVIDVMQGFFSEMNMPLAL